MKTWSRKVRENGTKKTGGGGGGGINVRDGWERGIRLKTFTSPVHRER